jgi:hypothetical protein
VKISTYVCNATRNTSANDRFTFGAWHIPAASPSLTSMPLVRNIGQRKIACRRAKQLCHVPRARILQGSPSWCVRRRGTLRGRTRDMALASVAIDQRSCVRSAMTIREHIGCAWPHQCFAAGAVLILPQPSAGAPGSVLENPPPSTCPGHALPVTKSRREARRLIQPSWRRLISASIQECLAHGTVPQRKPIGPVRDSARSPRATCGRYPCCKCAVASTAMSTRALSQRAERVRAPPIRAR